MLKAIKKVAAPHVLRAMRSMLSRYNYAVVKKPAALFGLPSAELTITFDFVLAHFLRGAPDVCFVQVGGFDGRTGDPLFDYVTHLHWKGVIVEPQPDAYEQLQANYASEPQVILLNAAVATNEGTRTLWRIRRGVQGLPRWALQLASFNRDTVVKHKAQIPNIEELLEATEVPCLTLSGAITKSGLTRVDILQIDVEGYDFEIVKMVDFERYKPAIIRFEHSHLHPDEIESCVDLLVRQGYRIGFEQYDAVAYRIGGTEREVPGAIGTS